MSKFAYDYNPSKTSNYKDSQIDQNKFFSWTKDHMYRTSYGNHWTNKPLEPRNLAPPGYGGYIPSFVSSNKFGNTFTQTTKECLGDDKLGQNPFKLSSTGFNHKRYDHIDPSATAKSHKYGRQTLPQPHPCVHPENWESQTKFIYRHPKEQLNPTFRETEKFLQTSKKMTVQSGFTENKQTLDGTGWVPERVLDGDRRLTEYRLQYNPEMPFQRDPTKFKVRKPFKKEYNYKYT